MSNNPVLPNRSVGMPGRQAGAPAQRAPANPQLRILGNILRMHLVWVALLGAALATASVALILRYWEPMYEAKMYVRVIQNPGYFQIVPERFQTQTNPKDELAPIRSELLLNRVLASEDIRGLPSIATAKSKVKELGKMLSYRSAGGQELYEIVCTSTSPKDAVKLVTEATNVYLDYVSESRKARLQEIGKDLTDEINLKKKEIETIQGGLARIAGERQGVTGDNSIYDPEGEYLTELQKSKSDLQTQIIAAEVELAMAPGIINAAESGRDSASNSPETASAADPGTAASPSRPSVIGSLPPDELEMYVETDGEVSRLKQERGTLLVQRQDKIGRGKGDNHPEVKSIDLALKKVDRDLLEARSLAKRKAVSELAANSLTGGTNGGVVVGPDQQLISAQAAELQAKIAGWKRQLEYFDEEIAKQRAQITANNESRNEFELKQGDLTRAMGELDRLLDAEATLHFRKLSLPYQIALEGNEKAQLPEAPLEEYPLKLLALALAASFGIPIGLAFLWELRSKRISESDQLVQDLPCGVVGEVAMVPLQRLGAKSIPGRLIRDKQIYQESVDKISTLLALTAEEGNQVVAITSAVSHEGKSTFASQLAISLARSTNQEVLLIDADLRSPVQHRLFETSNMTGLVDAIREPESWQIAIQDTKVKNLYVLPAGRAPSRPTSCFVNNSWERLLEQAQARFGIIVVDTPPVLSTSESVAICRGADRTLLCVLRDVSRTDAVNRAHQQLTAANVHVLGCVFGGIKHSAYTYRYGGEYQASDSVN